MAAPRVKRTFPEPAPLYALLAAAEAEWAQVGQEGRAGGSHAGALHAASHAQGTAWRDGTRQRGSAFEVVGERGSAFEVVGERGSTFDVVGEKRADVAESGAFFEGSGPAPLSCLPRSPSIPSTASTRALSTTPPLWHRVGTSWYAEEWVPAGQRAELEWTGNEQSEQPAGHRGGLDSTGKEHTHANAEKMDITFLLGRGSDARREDTASIQEELERENKRMKDKINALQALVTMTERLM